MKIEDFQKLKDFIEKEMKIDKNNILEKTIQISNLYPNLLKIYSKERRNLKNLDLLKDKLYGELYHHYKFKFDFSLDSKSEIDTYVKSDDKYYQICLEYNQQEIQVDFRKKFKLY
jgi:hypothetical protein